MLKNTKIFELEEEIDKLNTDIRRLNVRIRILEQSNEELKTMASIMCSKTYRLLKGLKLSDEDIFAYYRESHG